MKALSACVIIALVALVLMAKADILSEMKVLCKNCSEESKATEEELHKFYKNGMKEEFVNDKIKCHIKCMMEKLGTFKDGVFDDKVFVEDAKKAPFLKDHIEAIAKAAADCKAVKGANACDTAYKIAYCFKEKKEAAGVPKMLNATLIIEIC